MSNIGPQAFRWRFSGDKPLPSLTAAYRVGWAARAAVYRGAEMCGLMPLPDSFHNATDETHSHAFWLTEDADGDGRIDHVLLFAVSGIPWALLPVLAERARLELADLGSWRLLPTEMGSRISGMLFGPARRWGSTTAYVTPLARQREKRNGETHLLDTAEQLRWEIGQRKLGARLSGLALSPAIVRGEMLIPAVDFTVAARRLSELPPGRRAPRHWSPPRDADYTAAELSFDRPVSGPLAFGFGAHFGLGLFEPVE